MKTESSIVSINEWPESTVRLVNELKRAGAEHGIFSTGIENSDPFVDGVRRNQLKEAFNFYVNWESRLERIHGLGIRWLRFGEGYSQVHLGKKQYNFDLTDKVLAKCNALGITVIADLLHFGLPEWMHENNATRPFFQNEQFPHLFAEFARDYARRYPFVQYFTLINEPSVTAALSAQAGLWNEQLHSDHDNSQGYVRAITNIAKAAILARDAIREERAHSSHEPIFVINESFEKYILSDGCNRHEEVENLNLNHLAALDLIFGHHSDNSKAYLLCRGLPEDEYMWFMTHGDKHRFVLGIDYYFWCVKNVSMDSISPELPLIPERFKDAEYQLYDMAAERCERYGYIPLLHTEFNAWPENAVEMCHKTYEALKQLRKNGYPILGMGWYGDELQIGWHWILSGPNAHEETPVGLFYKSKKQPVADVFAAYAIKGFPNFPDMRE
jgi:beta-glucosidase/6-phospho-beta-glucosidase/beta-galactosidase